MKIVAAYGLFSTKGIEGCGGDTHLVTVAGDIAAYVHKDLISEMEKLFSAYDGIEARAFYYSVGYPSDDSKEVDKTKLLGWLSSLREDFIKLASKM